MQGKKALPRRGNHRILGPMKIRTYLYTLIIFLAPMLSYGQESTSTTEEVLPSLPGLASPDFVPSVPLSVTDPAFPKHLEKMGDSASAILEWRRIAFTTEDASLKAQAYFHIGRLYYLNDQPEESIKAFENFGAHFPKDTRTNQALYYMTLSSIQLDSKETPSLIGRMEERFADTEWTKSARYAYLWSLAKQGKETGFKAKEKQEKQLLQILKPYPTNVDEKAWMATLLSFLPGAGHLYLDSLSIAAAAFVINFIFFMAFLHALREKQWAYSMVLGLIFSCIYFGTIFSSYTLTYSSALSARLDAMASWENMHPTTPEVNL